MEAGRNNGGFSGDAGVGSSGRTVRRTRRPARLAVWASISSQVPSISRGFDVMGLIPFSR